MDYEAVYEKAREEGKVENMTPVYFRFDEPGVMFVGEYVGSNSVAGRLSDQGYNQYLFKTNDGLIKCAMGHVFDLEVGETLVKGDIYAIMYEGTEKLQGGKRVNKFKVEHIINDAVNDDESGLESF